MLHIRAGMAPAASSNAANKRHDIHPSNADPQSLTIPFLKAEDDSKLKQMNRAGSTSSKGTGFQVAKAALNLVNTGTGTSTVSMPMVTRSLGVGVALFAATLQSVLGIAANHFISRESEKEGADSYFDLMEARFGKWGGRFVAVAQAVNSLGKLVVWLIILADVIVGTPGQGDGLLPEVMSWGEAAEGRWYMKRWPWILLIAAASLPAISIRSLDKLAGISIFGDLACLLVAGAGVGLWINVGLKGEAHHMHWLPSKEEVGVSSWGMLALEVGSALPVMMGAAFTQNNINCVMGQVRPYRQGALDLASSIARGITMALFLLLGISNYAVFGREVKPDILSNYSREGLRRVVSGRTSAWLSGCTKGAFLVNGLVSLPMYLHPFQINLWEALPSQRVEQRMGEWRSFLTTNYSSMAGCALVAMLVPNVWKPLKLLGATAVSAMAFIFPGAIIIAAARAAAANNYGSGDGSLPLTPADSDDDVAGDSALHASEGRVQGGGGEGGRWKGEVAVAWVMVGVGVVQMVFGVVAQFL